MVEFEAKSSRFLTKHHTLLNYTMPNHSHTEQYIRNMSPVMPNQYIERIWNNKYNKPFSESSTFQPPFDFSSAWISRQVNGLQICRGKKTLRVKFLMLLF